MFKPPNDVIRWLSIVNHYAKANNITPSLLLATIHIESGGNQYAQRYEYRYERRYIIPNKTWLERCKRIDIGTADAATSYGLMQIMFPTAWQYGCRNPRDLYDADENIRIGSAIIRAKLTKWGNPRTAMMAYNGGDGITLRPTPNQASKYADKVLYLNGEYLEHLKRIGQF